MEIDPGDPQLAAGPRTPCADQIQTVYFADGLRHAPPTAGANKSLNRLAFLALRPEWLAEGGRISEPASQCSFIDTRSAVSQQGVRHFKANLAYKSADTQIAPINDAVQLGALIDAARIRAINAIASGSAPRKSERTASGSKRRYRDGDDFCDPLFQTGAQCRIIAQLSAHLTAD